jgi:hypothetical protein
MKRRTARQDNPSGKSAPALTNCEIVVIAAFGRGAATAHIDTEDIAVKANEIAPGRFTWKKYPDQIDIDAVSKRLWDARNRGLVVGSERDGWQLTVTGARFARSHRETVGFESSMRLSLKERQWRRAEKLRLLTTAAHTKFRLGDILEITTREAQAFFRVDAYVSDSTVEDKVLRVFNAFGDDAELGPTVKHLARLVRESYVTQDHLRQKSC